MSSSGDSPSVPHGLRAFASAGSRGSGTGTGTGTEPRDAATVILLRPATGAGRAGPFAVYLVKRAAAVAFMGGAHVFPGGRVDPKTDPDIEAAGVREVEEECGVKLDVRHLRLFARWVTPEVEPKRFDARFFVAPVPAGQAAAADRTEVDEGEWLTPAEALERSAQGTISLPPPTLWNLADLAALPSIDAVLAEADARLRAGIDPVRPRPVMTPEERIALVLPGDPQYEAAGSPEGARPEEVPAGKRRRFELDAGQWRMYRAGRAPAG